MHIRIKLKERKNKPEKYITIKLFDTSQSNIDHTYKQLDENIKHIKCDYETADIRENESGIQKEKFFIIDDEIRLHHPYTQLITGDKASLYLEPLRYNNTNLLDNIEIELIKYKYTTLADYIRLIQMTHDLSDPSTDYCEGYKVYYIDDYASNNKIEMVFAIMSPEIYQTRLRLLYLKA